MNAMHLKTTLIAGTIALGVATSGTAQIVIPSASDVPAWVGNLIFGSTHLESTNPEAKEELPGLGHKFELFGGMHDAQDPENLTNDVITIDTTGDVRGGAIRRLPPGIRITALENQLQLKYFFVGPRTCAGGSPRIQLAIDTDGDGSSNGNAFGYVGKLPFGGGCLSNVWEFNDMTDDVLRWDLSQLGGTMTNNWDGVEAFITTLYPNHKVLSGSLVDDSGGFTIQGTAYYDLLTIENRTLEQDQDTVQK